MVIYRRYFRYIDANGNSHGRFCGQTPGIVAKKCAKQYSKTIPEAEHENFNIIIQEATRNSPRKKYFYNCKIIKLVTPVTVTIHGHGMNNNQLVTFRRKIICKKINDFNVIPKTEIVNHDHQEYDFNEILNTIDVIEI